MPISLAIPKFIGTVSLGLLTGISYTLTLTYPTLLSLPSATHASRTFSLLSRQAQLHLCTLGTLSLLAFQSAFFLSPRRARHPYLLWTSLLAFGSVAQDVYLVAKSVVAGGPSTIFSKRGAVEQKDFQGSHLGESQEWEDVSELGVNGEMVEKRVRAAQIKEIRRAVIGGVAFALGVVGLWGDGA
ncbi:putative autophagy-related protein 33 [Elsinoe fawcettii]|nr:putative autophagy-related protein 33 [Elsinoe fawcettii]